VETVHVGDVDTIKERRRPTCGPTGGKRRHATSAEDRRFLTLALPRLPQKSAADTAQSLAAAGKPDLGVRHAEVAPARTPAAPARTHRSN